MANGDGNGNGSKAWNLVGQQAITWLVRLAGGGILALLVWYTASNVDSGITRVHIQALQEQMRENTEELRRLRDAVIRLGGNP